MKAKIDLSTLKQLSKIELFLLLCGAVTVSFCAAPTMLIHAEEPMPPLMGGTEPPPKLNLTAEQQAKFQQIKQASHAQMAAILTPEQQSQLESAKEQQEKARQAFAAVNLTADQKAKMQAIMQSSRKQFEAILTAEQREQLRQNRPKSGDRDQPPLPPQ